jgi:hypothetical protein
MKRVLVLLFVAATAHAETTERGTTTAPISAKVDDEEGVPKLSLPTEADRIAWRRTGFRLGLGLAYGRFEGLHGAPSGRLLGAQLHAGLRLDETWSIYASFQYASVSGRNGLSGLRFAGTIDPTWHVTPAISLAVGAGFGGIVEGRTGRMEVDPLPSGLDTSVTLPSASPPLPSCSGVGAAVLARAAWTKVLGPRSSTDIALEAIGQYTECVQRTGRLDADTAQPIVRRQYWPHAGLTLSWGVAWR